MEEMKYSPEYVPEYDATIYRVPFGMSEEVIPNVEDGGYSVYVHEGRTREEALNSARHAFRHIKENSWADKDVQEIEARTHSRALSEEYRKTLEKLKKERERRKRRLARLTIIIERRNKLLEELRIDEDEHILRKAETWRTEPPYIN